MLKVITFNANGIRSAAQKGFFTWLAKQNADVICVQETKAQLAQLDESIFCPANYHCYYFDAEKKGYSGVAIYARKKPDNISTGLNFAIADKEGRYIQADFGNLSVASIYVPSGSSGDERQNIKYQFMDEFEKILAKLAQDGRSYILCGDWNIAHKEIDLKNWRANQKASGFLPQERAWMDMVFGKLDFVDAFRVINQEPDQYTWWSLRSKTAFAQNVGWRIDYQVVTHDLKNKVIDANIYREEKFSDHAPVIIQYKI